MIIDFNRTIAYRCPRCGEIAYGNFSIFELSGGKGISVQCSCGGSDIRLTSENKSAFSVTVECLLCDERHQFTLPFTTLAKKDCTEFSCPNVSVGLVFIGHEAAVRKNVIENERYIAEVISACGLDHTGKNGVTMLKALDKIQELSDDEKLYCDCGSKLIDVEVHEDSLTLECCLCGAKMKITADEIRKSDFSHIETLILRH